MDPLLRSDCSTFHLLDYSEEMHPIGAQIVGSDPCHAGPSAKIIEELGFDLVDLNCGCPVDKVTKDGSGSGLLREPEQIGDIVAEMVAAVDIPVTLKIRAGWDSTMINAEEIVEVAEKAGAALISIHGRTRSQGYKGVADRAVIGRAKARAKKILVAGNGDIFDVDSALHMFEMTKCDAVLVSRGAMGQPWLGKDILDHLNGRTREEHDPFKALIEHFDLICRYRHERRALLDMRRVGPWYCKNAPFVGELRGQLAKVSSLDEAYTLLDTCLASC